MPGPPLLPVFGARGGLGGGSRRSNRSSPDLSQQQSWHPGGHRGKWAGVTCACRNVFTKELKNSLGIKGQAEFHRPGLACLVGGQHDRRAARQECRKELQEPVCV